MIALLAAMLLSQGLTQSMPGQSGGKVLASFPLVTSGPLIDEDANTVAHVYWNGTALVDTKGNAWTANGSIPMVTANPFTTTRYGAGPFAADKFYSLASPNALQFASTFTVCVVWIPAAIANQRLVYVHGTNTGWQMLQATGSNVTMYTGTGSALTATAAGGYTVGAPTVACVGRDATKSYAKANLGTTVSATLDYVAPAGAAAYIGDAPATIPQTGTIYEVYATSTPFTEATVVAIQQKVLGHYDGYSPLSVTRATNATYAPRSAEPYTLFTAAPGVARITDQGLLVEPARTNYALQSNTMSTGASPVAPWATYLTIAIATVAGAPTGGSWTRLATTGGSTTALLYQTTTTASATGFVGSAWMVKESGAGDASLLVDCKTGSVTACSCLRSDGGTCTAATISTSCAASVADLGTTPVRLSAVTTCNAARTTIDFNLSPGIFNSSVGVTKFSGAQLEVGTYPTSLIVTTTTATARNADQISATVPAVPAKWCWAVTALPEEGAAWATLSAFRFWGLGTAGGNNAAFANATLFRVEDGTSADKDLATTLPATGSIRPIWCNTSGVLSVAGITQGSASGAGTGLFATAPTTLYIGQRSSGAEQFSGFLKSLKLWSAKSTKEASK
jgi:hypothetical protein